MTPVLCMVTDRRRYGADWPSSLPRRVREAAIAGVHVIQVREGDLDGGALATLVSRCLEAVRGTIARVIVNDRVDVALAVGAHGAHLRTDSAPGSRVRQLTGAHFLLGRSVHSAEEAAHVSADGGLDYLVFGTVFASASKPGQAAAGLTALRHAVAATPLPVLAIGGIVPDRFADVALAGAAGIAAIGMFAGQADSWAEAVVAAPVLPPTPLPG